MPRKKFSDCSEHAKLMKVLKARLIQISLKVESYIYKKKPITKLQAKAFLNEISSYKSHCQNDIGYIQVIEKLTKYMNIIISKKINENPVKGFNSSQENIVASNNITMTNEKLTLPVDALSKSINHDTQYVAYNTTDNQNNVGLTHYNESILTTEANNADKYISDKKDDKETRKEERINVKEALYLKKGDVTNVSSKLSVNGAHIENSTKKYLSKSDNNVEQGKFNDDSVAATNNVQTSLIPNKVQSLLNNDYHLLICIDGGVLHDIKNCSNVTVVRKTPELKVPLNAYVLNSTKMPNIVPETHPNAMENNLKIKPSEEPKTLSVIDKSCKRKINNKKSKFTATYNDSTNISKIDKKSEDENKNNKELLSATSGSAERNILPKKQRARKNNGTKKKNESCIKETQGINDKKSKHPAVKRKVNKGKNIVQNILPVEVKSNANKLKKKARNDLSWFDNIKYIRKVGEKEYFKPLHPLEDIFWYNPSFLLPTADDRDFNI